MTLPKLEEYKAPWEVDSNGAAIPEDEQKLDPSKLKKFLHNLLSDKGRAQEKVTEVTAERDALQKAIDAEARKGEGDEAKRQREHDEALKAAEAKGSLAALKLEVALDVEGITPAQAKRIAARLTGKDRAELEADAKGLAEDFGIGKAPATDEGDPKVTPVTKPRRLSASGDPQPDEQALPDPTDAATIEKLFPRF